MTSQIFTVWSAEPLVRVRGRVRGRVRVGVIIRVRPPIKVSGSAMARVRNSAGRRGVNYEWDNGVSIVGGGQEGHLASACRYFLFHDRVMTASS